ncbi:LysR family transcriptional regulator [Cedecea davisae]|uniref:LysR family transcriptional regulator n=1 Tax=Cedecea davisae TaxID=158484 RepID=UPI002431FAB7|nr:LysR family transcriptional regulator [Cedecea davisae]
MIFNDRTFDGLAVFTAVVESGTFAAAAEVINMSPPGVSRAIARLEKRLGIRLFDRTTRAVSLTVEGKEFYRQVLPLLAALEDVTSGHGIAQMMTFGSEDLVKKGLVVDLFPDWHDERFPLYAYYPSRINPAARTRCFLDFILGLAKA